MSIEKVGLVGLNELAERVAVLRARRDDAHRRLSELDGLLVTLRTQADLLNLTEAALQTISSQVLAQTTTSIDQLVTAGLKLVFYDQNLTFSSQVVRSRGRTGIDFQLSDNGKIKPLLDAYGGSVLVVAGVLLRVVAIMTLKLRRVLILDESLAAVSSQYVESCSKFLRALCEKLQFDIIMVSHEPEFASHAHTHYEAHVGPEASCEFVLKRARAEA